MNNRQKLPIPVYITLAIVVIVCGLNVYRLLSSKPTIKSRAIGESIFYYYPLDSNFVIISEYVIYGDSCHLVKIDTLQCYETKQK